MCTCQQPKEMLYIDWAMLSSVLKKKEKKSVTNLFVMEDSKSFGATVQIISTNLAIFCLLVN